MKALYSYTFKKGFKRLPREIKAQAEKQLILLLKNFCYPSLRVKKIKGTKYIWEARISKNYRFTFQKQDNIIILRKIGAHKRTLKRP